MRPESSWTMGRLLDNPDVDYHVVSEILISRNQSIALFVLETDSLRAGWARVQAIEILDRSDNGVRGIMRINLDTHGQARAVLRRICEEKLECDTLGCSNLPW